jgi:hypothetical protein
MLYYKLKLSSPQRNYSNNISNNQTVEAHISKKNTDIIFESFSRKSTNGKREKITATHAALQHFTGAQQTQSQEEN